MTTAPKKITIKVDSEVPSSVNDEAVASMLKVIVATRSPTDLLTSGALLMGIGAARAGDTILEARDTYRSAVAAGERALMGKWDQLRNVS